VRNFACALVLGGYVNGYCIIRELYEKGVEDIILLDSIRSLASFSNKIKKFLLVQMNPISIVRSLKDLHRNYEKIVLFPTDDHQIELLHEVYDEISSFCFIPFNNDNIVEVSSKAYQYECCDKLGIPHPISASIQTVHDLAKLRNLSYPIIIKPVKRYDIINSRVFRSIVLRSHNDMSDCATYLKDMLRTGISFLASEVIPGDDSCIYAYVGYRSRCGSILNEWTGKKLSQYPDEFGVFSSASNQAPEIIRQQGRKLLEGMDLVGINEPEFKYDERDQKYKLTEINLRSMMWHRMGNLSGVSLQYTQYLDALSRTCKAQRQERKRHIHLVYLKHELLNLLNRRHYVRNFVRNIFHWGPTRWAVWDLYDVKPFLVDYCRLVSIFIRRYLPLGMIRRVLPTSLYRLALRLKGVVARKGCCLSRVRFAGKATIEPYCRLIGDPIVRIGSNVYINAFCHFLGDIEIGDNTMIGPQCIIWDRDHRISRHKLIREQTYVKTPVYIGSDVWIGANVTILKGVRIGQGAVIGGGAVVTHDIPAYTVAVGNPAKVLKRRD